jgi:hypothetical protein
MKKYLPRLVEPEITKQMKAMGCVVIDGPKWCGKSTTGERFAKTIIKLQKKEVFQKYKTFTTTDSSLLFEGERPIMFDEWHLLPELWDYVRVEIDESRNRGDFILTGSARPMENPNRHSGIGRIVKVMMRPLSLWESGESTGQVSLGDLFKSEQKIGGNCSLRLRDIAYVICRGGFPETIGEEKEIALTLSKNYYRALVEHDITNLDGIKRNPERAKKIMQSYARNVSSTATRKTIKEDITSTDDTLDEKTLDSYINAFRKLFVIEDLPAWSPKLRSATTIRASVKRGLVDPSIAAAALGASPDDLVNDMNTFGLLFENLCVRDLRIYAESLGGMVYHYQDNGGLEADAIVHMENGDWGAVEVKLGAQDIETAATNLLKLKERVDEKKMKVPKFLMVLTGLDYAYKRHDGVLVVPIGCLKN